MEGIVGAAGWVGLGRFRQFLFVLCIVLKLFRIVGFKFYER